MGNCATGPKKSKSGEEAEAPIPAPEDAAAVTAKKEETATRDVDLTAIEPKVEPEETKGDVSTAAVDGLAVVAAETATVVVAEGGEEEIIEKVKQVVLDEESTAEDAAGKRLSLSKLFNKEEEVKTPEESDKTSSEPTKEVESSETVLVIKESESVSKVEVAVESVVVPESTPEPKLAVETPSVAIEKVIEVAVAEKATEKQEKKPEEETKA